MAALLARAPRYTGERVAWLDPAPSIDDVLGGGPFNLPRGYWTDDTSMALCHWPLRMTLSVLSRGPRRCRALRTRQLVVLAPPISRTMTWGCPVYSGWPENHKHTLKTM